MSNQKFKIEDIYKLLDDVSGVDTKLNPQTDIFAELNIYGDDFHELMERYQKLFGVNMNSYLWYFHGDEEGSSFPGGLFFKAPHERVNRIPLTPELLLQFANLGTWDMKYPIHELPKRRYDLLVNSITFTTFFVILAILLLLKYFF